MAENCEPGSFVEMVKKVWTIITAVNFTVPLFAVAENIDSVRTNADNIDVIKTVGDNIDDVTDVAENLPKIDTVLANMTPIEVNADNIDVIKAVGDNIDDVTDVADDLVNIAIVANKPVNEGNQLLGISIVKGVQFMAQECAENEVITVPTGTNAFSVGSFTLAAGASLVIEPNSVYKIL